jgi:uncharacterized protein YijF (DUF1287 family)
MEFEEGLKNIRRCDCSMCSRVPADRGVCTDVVIRAYRAMAIDLQVCVHQDMLFSYPIMLQRSNRSRVHRLRAGMA